MLKIRRGFLYWKDDTSILRRSMVSVFDERCPVRFPIKGRNYSAISTSTEFVFSLNQIIIYIHTEDQLDQRIHSSVQNKKIVCSVSSIIVLISIPC